MNGSTDETWAPPVRDRIRAHSKAKVNRRIDRATRGAIDEACASPAAAIRRLGELDRRSAKEIAAERAAIELQLLATDPYVEPVADAAVVVIEAEPPPGFDQ